MHDPEVLAHRITIPWPGHRYGMELVTIWHMEPGGADALTVCKHGSRWRWHIHHWRLSFPILLMSAPTTTATGGGYVGRWSE